MEPLSISDVTVKLMCTISPLVSGTTANAAVNSLDTVRCLVNYKQDLIARIEAKFLDQPYYRKASGHDDFGNVREHALEGLQKMNTTQLSALMTCLSMNRFDRIDADALEKAVSNG
jgi:hypothetical protein